MGLPLSGSLAGRRSPEVAAGSVLLVPLGSTEQHGPHLPLGTDTIIAAALCAAAADRLRDTHRAHPVEVAPALPYGSSGEHAAFAGTLSIGQEALEHLLVELVRGSDPSAWRMVVFVNGHGGNAGPVRRAADRLRADGRAAWAWSPPSPSGGDAHAGWVETSVLLALDPALVAPPPWPAGNTAPVGELLAQMRRGGVAAVAPGGVLGDPSGATAERGRAVLDAWVGALVDALVGGFTAGPAAGLAADRP